MKIKNSFFALAAILSTVISARNLYGALERVTPESQGIPSEAVLDLIDKLEEQNGDVHSYMLIRNGKVVAEGHWAPFAAQLPHTLYSVSKAFVSMAIGMAIEDGLLALDDKVVKFYPEAAGENIDERHRRRRDQDGARAFCHIWPGRISPRSGIGRVGEHHQQHRQGQVMQKIGKSRGHVVSRRVRVSKGGAQNRQLQHRNEHRRSLVN